MDKHTKKFSIHASHYFISQIIIVLGGFITFPLLTRSLSISEYGILSLINSTVAVLLIFSKFGLQNATVRFYPEAKKNGVNGVSQLASTILFSSVFLALFLATVLYFFISKYVPGLSDFKPRYVLFIASILLLIRSLYLVLMTFMRANQQSASVSIFNVSSKLLGVACIFIGILFIKKSIVTYYYAVFISEFIILLLLILKTNKTIDVSFKRFSIKELGIYLSYGLPLLGFEFVTEVLAYGDRYLIQYFLGPEQLATYSAGYNLADYVRNILLYPMAFAVMPILMDVWENKGKEETEQFVSNTLKTYWLLIIPSIFGVSYLGKDIIVLLASERYELAHMIIPYVITGATVYGTFPLTGAGLYVKNKTSILLLLVSIATALNIVLNIILIPDHGIKGAGEATLISYLILAIMITLTSRKFIKVKMGMKSILIGIIGSSIMVFILMEMKKIIPFFQGNLTIWIVVAILSGALIYLLVVISIDSKSRNMLLDLFHEKILKRDQNKFY